jgi:hypothetical protein
VTFLISHDDAMLSASNCIRPYSTGFEVLEFLEFIMKFHGNFGSRFAGVKTNTHEHILATRHQHFRGTSEKM